MKRGNWPRYPERGFDMNTVTQEKKSTNKLGMLFILLTLGAGSTMLMSACNTVEGAGEDIEAAGDSISDTASDAKD